MKVTVILSLYRGGGVFGFFLKEFVQSQFLYHRKDHLQVIVESCKRVIIVLGIFSQYEVTDGELCQAMLAFIRFCRECIE